MAFRAIACQVPLDVETERAAVRRRATLAGVARTAGGRRATASLVLCRRGERARAGVSPPVTLADVARTAGVSPTTASFVLSGRGGEMRISRDVAERVLMTAEKVQYRPNILSVGLRTG